MRKLLFLLLVFVAPVLAQNPTLVTGTITDPNGVAWYPGTVTATLSPATAINPTVNGQRINTNSDNTQMRVMTSTNPDGSFSMSLFPNAAITPGGTQWVFFVYTNGSGQPAGLGPKNFTVTITIAGASQDVGATLRAAAPVLLGAGGGGGAVSSVFTRTGAVVAAANDYSFAQLSGSLAHAQLPVLLSADIPNNTANTSGLSGTATALATLPTKCSAGNYPLGVDVSGNAQNCTPNVGAVASVFGRTGTVVAAANDYTLSQIGLSPLTTSQDILYDNAGTLARLPIVTSGNCLGNTAGAWASIVCGGGSGTISSGTTNTLPKYTASTTIGNSLLSDSGTLLSYTGTGGISSTSDGVHPGNLSMVGNTTVVTPATNTFNIMGPSSATFTAYALQFPSTAPTAGQTISLGAPSSGVSQVTYVAAGGGSGLSGTASLGTSAIASTTCATVVTVAATGTATTGNVIADFNADPTAVTGYTPSANGMLTIIKYPTINNVNFKVCNNTTASITPGPITLNWRTNSNTTIASGTSALGTSAIASAACATVVTAAATGALTTDDIVADFNADPTAVTGYAPVSTGMLTIIKYPTAGNVNFLVCNNTQGSITPGAITLNWRVLR